MWDYDTKLQGCRIFTPGRSSPSNIPLVWLLLLKRKQLANPIPKHWPWSWISLTSCCMFDGFSQGECPVGNVHGEMSRGRGMSSGKCPWGNVHGEMSRWMSRENVQWKCPDVMSRGNVHGEMSMGKCPGEISKSQLQTRYQERSPLEWSRIRAKAIMVSWNTHTSVLLQDLVRVGAGRLAWLVLVLITKF